MIEAIFAFINLFCTVAQTVCLIIIAFELSPWERKKNGEQRSSDSL